jgi:hypothetical protein
MFRSVLVLLVALLGLSPAHASLERKERPWVDKRLVSKAAHSFRSAPASDEYRVTESTEVLLDGRRCRYDQIPHNAIIILMETASNESKEVVRIHFRSPRRSSMPATSK